MEPKKPRLARLVAQYADYDPRKMSGVFADFADKPSRGQYSSEFAWAYERSMTRIGEKWLLNHLSGAPFRVNPFYDAPDRLPYYYSQSKGNRTIIMKSVKEVLVGIVQDACDDYRMLRGYNVPHKNAFERASATLCYLVESAGKDRIPKEFLDKVADYIKREFHNDPKGLGEMPLFSSSRTASGN